jgi:hypothetical protein
MQLQSERSFRGTGWACILNIELVAFIRREITEGALSGYGHQISIGGAPQAGSFICTASQDEVPVRRKSQIIDTQQRPGMAGNPPHFGSSSGFTQPSP